MWTHSIQIECGLAGFTLNAHFKSHSCRQGFRIQGQVYHLIGSIVPTQGESHKFAQIYFIGDEDSEVATRSAIVDGLKPDIIRGIN